MILQFDNWTGIAAIDLENETYMFKNWNVCL